MKKNKYNYDKDYEKDINDSLDKENNNKFKDFFDKYKNDKKYKAKVQLTGYLVFIIILIIFLNISDMGKNYDYSSNNNTNDINTTNTSTDDGNDELSLLKRLNNNYAYDVKIALKRLKDDNTEENITFSYNGKSYGENIIINKSINNVNSTFYKAGDEYYKKANEEYELMAENEIYDIISAKYVEYSSLKKNIEKAELDHYTNYSSGKIEYVYYLKISDIIKSYKKDDKIEINIVEENDIINIDIDYGNLFKVLNNNISECVINYKYSDIDKVDKIVIFEEDNTTTSTVTNN